MMRIFYINDQEVGGGAEAHLRLLMEEVRSLGNDVGVV